MFSSTSVEKYISIFMSCISIVPVPPKGGAEETFMADFIYLILIL